MKNDMTDTNQIAITSPDGRQERLEQLRELFPDLFDGEGQLDDKALRALISNEAGVAAERFSFEWVGKQKSKRFAFSPSKATLQFDPTRSLNRDGSPNKAGDTLENNNSENLIIEGDNLEVLKLLQATYFEQVKCIYIDPPYNTGGDLIYPDDFSETKQEYWEKNGTVKDGVKLVALPETSGRRHSAWLNMMQSRLLLARQLLRDDGAIFISIDDNEFHNLRSLMDNIFGESNFVNCIAVKMSEASGVKMAHVKNRMPKLKEYILVYRKTPKFQFHPVKVRLDAWNEEYQYFLDSISKNTIDEIKQIVEKDECSNADILKIDTLLKNAKIVSSKKAYSETDKSISFEEWRWKNAWRIIQAVGSSSVLKLALKEGKDSTQEIRSLLSARKLIYLYKTSFNKDTKSPRIQIAFADLNLEQTRGDFWDDIKTTGGIGQEGGVIFPNGKKPLKLLQRIISAATNAADSDIVLDFFAGSGSTGHAITQVNLDDAGNRKFILVQVPELIDPKDELFSLGHKTIFDVCLARMSNVNSEMAGGFRVFKLAHSSFPENLFAPDPAKSEDENLKSLKAHLEKAAQTRLFDEDEFSNLVTEISLKNGFGLFYELEPVDELSKNKVYRLIGNDKSALLCLDNNLHDETVEGLKPYKDEQLIVSKSALDTTKKFSLQTEFKDNLWVV